MEKAKKVILDVLIVVGFFLFSNLNMVIFVSFQAYFQTIGMEKMPLWASIVLIAIILFNIGLMLFFAKKLGILSFKWDWSTKRNWLWIVGAYILGRVVLILITVLFDAGTTTNDATINVLFANTNPIVLFLLISVAAPIMEEIAFRGAIMGRLLKNYPLVGLIVSSIFFGSMHSPKRLSEWLTYISLGMILALPYYKTKRLQTSMVTHFINNFFPALFLIFS